MQDVSLLVLVTNMKPPLFNQPIIGKCGWSQPRKVGLQSGCLLVTLLLVYSSTYRFFAEDIRGLHLNFFAEGVNQYQGFFATLSFFEGDIGFNLPCVLYRGQGKPAPRVLSRGLQSFHQGSLQGVHGGRYMVGVGEVGTVSYS